MWFTQSNPTRLTPTYGKYESKLLKHVSTRVLISSARTQSQTRLFEPIKTQTCLIILNK